MNAYIIAEIVKLPVLQKIDMSFLWPKEDYSECRHIILPGDRPKGLERELVFRKPESAFDKGYIKISRYVNTTQLLELLSDRKIANPFSLIIQLTEISGYVPMDIVKGFFDLHVTMRQMWVSCAFVAVPDFEENPIVALNEVETLLT